MNDIDDMYADDSLGDALGKLILRLTVGGLMLFHGIAKVGNEGSLAYISGKLAEVNLPEQLVYGVFAGEILAPLLLIIGLFTRTGALLIIVNMLFAIGLSHSTELFELTKHGGWALELQGFYLFGALAIMLMGSGRMALSRS